jgi:hypothetical protein
MVDKDVGLPSRDSTASRNRTRVQKEEKRPRGEPHGFGFHGKGHNQQQHIVAGHQSGVVDIWVRGREGGFFDLKETCREATSVQAACGRHCSEVAQRFMGVHSARETPGVTPQQ